MRLVRSVVVVVVLLTAGFIVWKTADRGGSRERKPRVAAHTEPVAGSAASPAEARAAADLAAAANAAAANNAAATRAETLRRFAYAQAWEDRQTPLPVGMEEFRAWATRYVAAPAKERAALEGDGIALARARRAVLRDLIIANPRRALALAVPARIRHSLPPAVVAELETRVAGKGEFAVLFQQNHAGMHAVGVHACSMRRIAVLHGTTWTAHVYGRREAQTHERDVSLHGIAIDRELALHESPLRALEPGEIPPGASVDAGVNLEPMDAESLTLFADRLEAAEATSGSLGENGTTTTPPRAAEAPTERTLGTKRVLVIRVDFPDFPGEPIAQALALSLMNTGAQPRIEEMSYGQTSLVTTVSDAVYRMPQTGSSYALADNPGQLHTDARNLAAANYTLENYDRIIVVFPSLSPSRVPGSKITFGGSAILNGANILINGGTAFNPSTLTHELGHTYGLLHANLWRTSDGHPTSANGTSVEYGDPFDTMGSQSATGVVRDARHHFNPWHKNRLGWLPDSAVTTVAASGTYRIYRFDSKDSPAAQPLALRIFRDGVRWYWVGLRQNFASGSPRIDGAYVVWGFNNRQSSQLLDLTPGFGANDAALPLGATFSDSAYGISIKPIARGGEEPAQYLDVEVTVPPKPPNAVIAWGREGAYFFPGSTGGPLPPVPETQVPLDLSQVQSIAGGDQHALALKTDGTLIAWGDSDAGQSTIPAGLSGVAAIAAGGDVSGAVKRDGMVQLWGSAASGQTAPPAGLVNVQQLAIGRDHALALKSDGTVVAWGTNGRGQATVPPTLSDVVAIAAGAEFSVALKRDGTIESWGSTFGRPPAGTTGIKAISAHGALTGGQFVVALKADGTVMAWGANGSGQTDVPAGLSGIIAIAAGGFHALALKADGTVTAWGSSTAARTNIPREMPRCYAVAASSAASFAIAGSSISILAQPQDRTIAAGDPVTLGIAASGSGSLAYQWRRDGVAIAGATNDMYAIAAAAVESAGRYDVVLRDALGAENSAAFRLTVSPRAPEVSRISNLSIRTNAGSGAQTLIVGFVVRGTAGGAKPLLVRGVGPALRNFGVSGTLPDPKVELFNESSIKLLENDNWQAGDAPLFSSVGAFPLTAGSRDAVLYNGAIEGGSYSAQLSGVTAATGVVLAEIYDAMPPASFGAATPRLVNVSARALSGTGDNVLIAGFVIAGPTPKNVLIRGIGPTLSVFGVPGVLADPKLELFRGSTRMQENDNWGGTTELRGTFAAVGAFGLADASRDAALLATLEPGSYTAMVNGVGGTTGVALVEIYEAP